MRFADMLELIMQAFAEQDECFSWALFSSSTYQCCIIRMFFVSLLCSVIVMNFVAWSGKVCLVCAQLG